MNHFSLYVRDYKLEKDARPCRIVDAGSKKIKLVTRRAKGIINQSSVGRTFFYLTAANCVTRCRIN